MDEYISRNGLRNILYGKQMAFEQMGLHSAVHTLKGIIKLVNELDNPLLTIDIVRCKDCAVPHNKWLGCPNLNGLIPPPDFYCAKGERKE